MVKVPRTEVKRVKRTIEAGFFFLAKNYYIVETLQQMDHIKDMELKLHDFIDELIEVWN